MARLLIRRYTQSLPVLRAASSHSPVRVPTTSTSSSSRSQHDPLSPSHPIDSLCIPLGPAPSLPPRPTPPLSDSTLLKLHDLSALYPPGPIGSREWERLKEEVQGMIGIVEAVRGVDTTEVEEELEARGESVPDGRVWPEERGVEVDWDKLVKDQASFIQARRAHIPGSLPPSASSPTPTDDAVETIRDEKADRVLGMAKEGVQKVKRKGLGKRPEKEMWYYAVRTPKRGAAEEG